MCAREILEMLRGSRGAELLIVRETLTAEEFEPLRLVGWGAEDRKSCRLALQL